MSSVSAPTAKQKVELPYPPAAVGWYATILMALLYWLSILDRFIISLLVDPIKADLGMTDVQVGLLLGPAFAITFSLFGLAAGTLTDRLSRRWIIFVSVSVWSLATTACGMAHSFWQLFMARIGVGAGEAGLNPSATSIITDLFPSERLTMALAVFSVGASAGSGCAYLLGGLLVDLVSEASAIILPVIGEIRPWQAVFFLVGVPGIAISFMAFTMPEPVRRGRRVEAPTGSLFTGIFTGYVDLLKFIRSNGRFFFHHYTGFGLTSLFYATGVSWFPAHMGRTFGWSATEIGLGLGLTLVTGGIIGKLLCGICVDALFRRGYKDAQFRWYATCLLVGTPVGVVTMLGDSPAIFLGGLVVYMILLSSMPAVYMASLNLVTPNELRGAGIAFYSTTIGLITLSIGSVAIPALSDYVYGGNAIGQGLATLIAICGPLAALALATGCRAMREAVTQAEQWAED